MLKQENKVINEVNKRIKDQLNLGFERKENHHGEKSEHLQYNLHVMNRISNK
jgi:hypothetical protein